MSRVQVTRKIEFDAGHRIPNHKSKCRNLHGHRYVLEATFLGPVKLERGQSDDGMVADFSFMKQVMMEQIHDRYDHSFIMSSRDPLLHAVGKTPAPVDYAMLQAHGAGNFWVVDFVPTAEHLVEHFAGLIIAGLAQAGVKRDECLLHELKLYETPNCWATWKNEVNGG